MFRRRIVTSILRKYIFKWYFIFSDKLLTIGEFNKEYGKEFIVRIDYHFNNNLSLIKNFKM